MSAWIRDPLAGHALRRKQPVHREWVSAWANDVVQHRAEIRDQLWGVLLQLEDRLAAGQSTFIRELIGLGEREVALEWITDVIWEGEMGLRDDERNQLLMVNPRLGLGERVPSALSFCLQPA